MFSYIQPIFAASASSEYLFGKERVILLFLSLSRYPHLAKHVRRLELRDFPKALTNSDGLDIIETFFRYISITSMAAGFENTLKEIDDRLQDVSDPHERKTRIISPLPITVGTFSSDWMLESHTRWTFPQIFNQQTSLNTWMNEIAALLPATVPLETFQMYSSGAFIEQSPATEQLWSHLLNAHQGHLTRFSIHRMLISLNTIEDVCLRCTNLEQLFVVIEPSSLENLSSCLSLAPNLRVIHINYPLETTQMGNIHILPESDAQKIVDRCGPNVVQFGCNTRVWQVGREVLLDQHNAPVGIRRRVMRYQDTDR
ncbi:proteophosphoglycan ppg4 [Lentinula edodes]|uniref:Proteophosphoglycan ppg4 n=1 Tax=Lentinula edodes TaxID=5353 RepID=A0A1Q3EI77_LENED|nr:proteophosphoglycan ppg4 [Lentinula edodes]